jgi:subtilisin family serine protease
VRATTTPSPSPTINPANFACPSSGFPNSIARASGGSAIGEATTRRLLRKPAAGAAATPVNTLLAVSYARGIAASTLPQIAAREQALNANLVGSYDYPAQNVAMRVISVPTSSLAATEATLRAQAGVQSIGITGQHRYRLTTTPFYTNDPYFNGFPPVAQATPYAENSAVPGQWDMDAIRLPNAYGYSQMMGPDNTFGQKMNALGSSTIEIAIIDTGEDASHPELQRKIAYQHCFVSNEAGTSQTSGNYSTDYDGHGTDVSGIAAAASANNLGFTGAGGNAMIYAYRVFPTPDDTCANESGADDTCSADTSDIASAIDDAVAKGVNVISMSLGGGSCNNGVDTDPVEGAAVEAAIAAKVIVVAAAGNSGGQGLDAPACDTGVIAAGASALDDGVTTGTTSYSKNVAGASPSNIIEYVASYSQYGTPAANPGSASAWGIVAPGGDPSSAETSPNATADDLHWIENIWTSTPLDSNFDGECDNDYPNMNANLTTNPDCRTLIAGTSMATPHVAGAAALILAVMGPGTIYQTPATMKMLLCETADDISDTNEGCGRLNVYRAMARALGDMSVP